MNTQLMPSLRADSGNRLSFTWIAVLVTWLEMAVGPARVLARRQLVIDVSSYQGSINWSSVRGAGITFAWAKATEGTGYQDGYFTGNENNGKGDAGYFCNFAGPYIKGDGATLMPMLDIEGNAFTGNVGASSISDWVNQWCNAVVTYAANAGVRVKPIIYVSACNAGHFDSTVAQCHPHRKTRV